MFFGGFSSPKAEATMQAVRNGKTVVRKWNQIIQELVQDANECEYILAYNCTFDQRVIGQTANYMRDRKGSPYSASLLFQTGILDKFSDLWEMASLSVMYRQSFLDFCKKHGFLRKDGAPQTKAETCYRYILNNPEYVEKHIALDDIQDEAAILLAVKEEVGTAKLRQMMEKAKKPTNGGSLIRRFHKATQL